MLKSIIDFENQSMEIISGTLYKPETATTYQMYVFGVVQYLKSTEHEEFIHWFTYLNLLFQLGEDRMMRALRKASSTDSSNARTDSIFMQFSD